MLSLFVAMWCAAAPPMLDEVRRDPAAAVADARQRAQRFNGPAVVEAHHGSHHAAILESVDVTSASILVWWREHDHVAVVVTLREVDRLSHLYPLRFVDTDDDGSIELLAHSAHDGNTLGSQALLLQPRDGVVIDLFAEALAQRRGRSHPLTTRVVNRVVVVVDVVDLRLLEAMPGVPLLQGPIACLPWTFRAGALHPWRADEARLVDAAAARARRALRDKDADAALIAASEQALIDLWRGRSVAVALARFDPVEHLEGVRSDVLAALKQRLAAL